MQQKMSKDPSSVAGPEPTRQISYPVWLANHKHNVDPTQPDQLMITPKVIFPNTVLTVSVLYNLYFKM